MGLRDSKITIEDFFKNNVSNPDEKILEIGELKDRIYKKINKIKAQLVKLQSFGYNEKIMETFNQLDFAENFLINKKNFKEEVLISTENSLNRLIDYFDKKLNELE